MNSNSGSNNTLFLSIGTHTYVQSGFQAFLNHLDQGYLMASAREVFEYKWLKENQNIFLTQVQNGNQLTITYDLTKLPHQIRWRDLTFQLPEGISIKKIEVNGADKFTHTDNIFNIYKEKLKWSKTELDPLSK